MSDQGCPMNRKTVLFFAAVIATIALVWHNREPIMLRLGFESALPAYYRAIDLAKNARTIDRYDSNHVTIRNRLRVEGGDIDHDGWQAERLDEVTFKVTYSSPVDGRTARYEFEVDAARREVSLLHDDGDPFEEASLASPR